MALNDVLPLYTEPCVVDRSDSDCLSALDYGEFYYVPQDSQEYPNVTLVYNGRPLDVQSELVHASLSGISIKHYYGKCYQETTEDEEVLDGEGPFNEYNGEMDAYDWFGVDNNDMLNTETGAISKTRQSSESQTDSFEYREDSMANEGQPICTLPKINFRNSFWNIHRPELCKLTWGQKYVSAATVTDHLHEHLTHHGELCYGIHAEEDRMLMLNKELDEYVRLKVIACPRELPPDEPFFNFREEAQVPKLINPRCKGVQRKFPAPTQNRYYPIKDDEEIQGKSIRRSKAEFCLTIGKYVSEPIIIKSLTMFEEAHITPQPFLVAEEGEEEEEEEVGDLYFYNWLFYGEASYEGNSTDTRSTILSTESEPQDEPCPPLMLDDFCRVAGKADFSDLRCDPDF